LRRARHIEQTTSYQRVSVPMSAKVLVTALSLCLLHAVAAGCESDTGSCNDETSFVQVKHRVQVGSDRPERVDALEKGFAKRLEGFKKKEMENIEGKLHKMTAHKETMPRNSQKAQSFIGTIGNRKWHFWFKKASNNTAKDEKSNLAEIAKGGDHAEFFSLAPSSSDGAPYQLEQWGWHALDDWWGPGPLGNGCPDLGLGLPGCSWADQALTNGWRWNDIALGLPDYVPGYGRWGPPPFRHWWSVFAALPADKKEPMELLAKPEEVAMVEYDIEKQMKAANYKVTPPAVKKAELSEH